MTQIYSCCILLLLSFTAPAQDGYIDSTFGTEGYLNYDRLGAAGSARTTVLVRPDGKVVLVGTDEYSLKVLRFNVNGTPDAGFGAEGVVMPGREVEMQAARLLPDGKMLVTGLYDGGFDLWRLQENGRFDSSFGINGRAFSPGGGARPWFRSMLVQPDGKTIVAGFASQNSEVVIKLARFLGNGTLDASFGTGGNALISLEGRVPSDLAIDASGNLLVLVTQFNYQFDKGDTQPPALLRIRPDGTPDPDYGGTGHVLVTIPPGFDGRLRKILLQPDGRVVLGGIRRTPGEAGTGSTFVALRVLPDGKPDPSFGEGGYVRNIRGNFDLLDFRQQVDGMVLLTDWVGPTRLLPNGVRDAAFRGDPRFGRNDASFTQVGYSAISMESAPGRLIGGGVKYNSPGPQAYVAVLRNATPFIPRDAPGALHQSVPGLIEAETFTAFRGIQTEPTADVGGGGANVGYQDREDFLEYRVQAAAAGVYSVTFRVASAEGGARFSVTTPAGTVSVNVPTTGAWQTWTDITAQVPFSAGQQTVRLTTTGTGHWNINWMELRYPESSAYVPVPSRIEAEAYTSMQGVEKEATADAGGGQNVGYIDRGDRMTYRIIVPEAGWYPMSYRVATTAPKAEILIRQGTGHLGWIVLPDTGGWQAWQTVTTLVQLPAGPIEITLESRNEVHWNLNWFEVGPIAKPYFTPVPARIEAEDYRAAMGVREESTTDTGGGNNLGFIDPDDFMTYAIRVPNTGQYNLTLRLATAHSNNPRIDVQDERGNVLATVQVPNTGWWQAWTSVTVPIFLSSGQQRITLRSVGEGAWNINWLEFSHPSAAGSRQSTGWNRESGVGSKEIKLYPIPATVGTVTLSLNSAYAGPLEVHLLDASGRQLKRYRFIKATDNFIAPLDLSYLKQGVYHLMIREGDRVRTVTLTRM